MTTLAAFYRELSGYVEHHAACQDARDVALSEHRPSVPLPCTCGLLAVLEKHAAVLNPSGADGA